MNELTIKEGEIIIPEEMKKLIKKARDIELKRKKLDIEMELFKDSLKEAMEEAGIKTFESDYFRATYVGKTSTARVDTKILKSLYPDIAEECTKVSERSTYIKVEFV